MLKFVLLIAFAVLIASTAAIPVSMDGESSYLDEINDAVLETTALISSEQGESLPTHPCTGRTGGEGMSFFTIWTTRSNTFTYKYMRSIESVFFHHPQANVTVYASGLNSNIFHELQELGCSIKVERLNLRARAVGTPMESWAAQLKRHKEESPHFYAHLSDAARLTILYNQGGTYMDTDAIFLKPVNTLKNAVGYERDDSICNAVILNFEKHSPYIFDAMDRFQSNYDPTQWAVNGPVVLTRVYEDMHKDRGTVTALGIDAFYPIKYDDISNYFAETSESEAKQEMARLVQSSYVIHYWNSNTHGMEPAKHSLMGHVLNDFCVLCKPLSGLPVSTETSTSGDGDSVNQSGTTDQQAKAKAKN